MRGVTGQPILFASTGENLGDFERFHAERMAGRILDMGDMLTLIEQAQKAYDQKEAEALARKMQKGQFTLTDFMGQLQQLRKMGSMKKLMGMLPGMNQYRDQLDAFDEKSIDRIEAIVNSMTPAERDDLSLLNGSRRARIARGSGTTVTEINGLVERFTQAAKMMKRMSNGGGHARDALYAGDARRTRGRHQEAAQDGEEESPQVRQSRKTKTVGGAASRQSRGNSAGSRQRLRDGSCPASRPDRCPHFGRSTR